MILLIHATQHYSNANLCTLVHCQTCRLAVLANTNSKHSRLEVISNSVTSETLALHQVPLEDYHSQVTILILESKSLQTHLHAFQQVHTSNKTPLYIVPKIPCAIEGVQNEVKAWTEGGGAPTLPSPPDDRAALALPGHPGAPPTAARPRKTVSPASRCCELRRTLNVIPCTQDWA